MRPAPEDETHTWHYEGSQEDVARQIMWHSGGGPTSMILKGHSIKWLLMTCYYACRVVHFKTLTGEAVHGDWFKDSQLVGGKRVRGYRVFNPKWRIYVKSPPSKTASLQKRDGKMVRAGSSTRLEHNMAIPHGNSQCIWQHAQQCEITRQISQHGRERGI